MRLIALAVAAALAAGCSEARPPAPPPPAPDASKPAAAAKWTEVQPDFALLKDPKAPGINKTAPDVFRAKFVTSKGDFVVEVTRAWAPVGADRFYNLARNGFFDDVRFFRVLTNFMAQFGINGNPEVAKVWNQATIQDDPVKESNQRGMVTYAKTGAPNSRSTQLFINFKDNSMLDRQGFAPFGKVVEGMEVVDALYKGYGEGAPSGRGPEQGRIQAEGNSYLNKDFPQLDYVKTARVFEKEK